MLLFAILSMRSNSLPLHLNVREMYWRIQKWVIVNNGKIHISGGGDDESIMHIDVPECMYVLTSDHCDKHAQQKQ